MSDSNPSSQHDEPEPFSSHGLIPTATERAKRERAEEENRQRKHNELVLDLQKRQTDAQVLQATSNRVMAGLTAALVIMTLANGFISYLQFRTAKASADAAQSAANTASETLRAMNNSGADTKAQIDRLIAQQQRTAEAMRDAVKKSDLARESSERQSSAALDASVEIFRNEQRAWVVIKNYETIFDDTTGIQVKIRLVNTGKTPAIKVRSAFDVQTVAPGQRPVFDRYLAAEPGSPVYRESQREAVIPPQGESSINGDPRYTRIPASGIRLIMAEKSKFYITGTILYFDVFKNRHTTEYCAVFCPATKEFDPCSEGHNTVN